MKTTKAVIVRLTVDVTLVVPKDATEDAIHDVINELEYSFKDTTGDAKVKDEEITNSEILEELD